MSCGTRKQLTPGAVIVSTPQDVALIDARKGVAMFNKVNVPIVGLLLNMSHFICGSCDTPHELFGSADKFVRAADELGHVVLGECGLGWLTAGKVPLVTSVSDGGDAGRPVMVQSEGTGEPVREVMRGVGEKVWQWLLARPQDNHGVRG